MDLEKHLIKQKRFSESTFGPGHRTLGICDHIRKELVEVEKDVELNNDPLEEWVDIILLALDGAWRCGASPEEVCQAITAKQLKNEKRSWPDWRSMPADKAIEHDRSKDSH